ncbi:MAG: hypothetical protein K0Q55_672 [Verrucomicrobia bacterium]|jgi:hypothetical protein|nr:hypothetical protein [Verrucomicrobiota bacterium]
MLRSGFINKEGSRSEAKGCMARRDEGEYPQRSSTEEQQRQTALRLAGDAKGIKLYAVRNKQVKKL